MKHGVGDIQRNRPNLAENNGKTELGRRGGRGSTARVLDAAGDFEFIRKGPYFGNDAVGLLRDVFDEANGHLRLATDQFRSGDNEGKVVVYIVAHNRKLFVQVSDLFGCESDRFIRQKHKTRCTNELGLGKRHSNRDLSVIGGGCHKNGQR